MNKLPKWVIPSKFPALFDLESATAIEMTAKVYSAMQEMIADYNKFVETVNANIDEFENRMISSFEEFSVGFSQAFQDFIDSVETTISVNANELNERVTEAESYMRDNMPREIQNTINSAIKNGSLRIGEEYDEATESYNLIVTGGV